MQEIGFIGAGQMAQALAAGIARSNPGSKFCISDPSEAARNAFVEQVGSAQTRSANSNAEVFASCGTIFLAVKPQYFAAAMENVKQSRSTSTLVVSVMAGVPIQRIQAVSGVERVIRVMPNTPCLIGKGACAMALSETATAADAEIIQRYLESVGMVTTVTESLLDAVTGLSGSGPAYVFTFIESLIQGAVLSGMPLPTAEQLAVQTVLGAAMMVQETGEQPAVLRDRVTSPGGTTIAGLKALEEHGFRNAVMSAVQAATERSRELGKM